MRYLDANIFLRALVEPETALDRAKAQACAALFRRLAMGEETAITTEAVVCEVAYVLRSRAHYGLPPTEVSARVRPILALKGLKLPQKRLYIRALDIYAGSPFLDYEDAVSVAYMERRGIEEILSYDTDFDRVPGIQRVEP